MQVTSKHSVILTFLFIFNVFLVVIYTFFKLTFLLQRELRHQDKIRSKNGKEKGIFIFQTVNL